MRPWLLLALLGACAGPSATAPSTTAKPVPARVQQPVAGNAVATRNDELALRVHLLEKACALDDEAACELVARYHLLGKYPGVTPDESLLALEGMCHRPHAHACMYAAMLHEHMKHRAESRRYITKACEAGYADACDVFAGRASR